MAGISLEGKSDSLGQQYTTPSVAIEVRGNDVIIVGRAIIGAADPAAAARHFKDVAYQAYVNTLAASEWISLLAWNLIANFATLLVKSLY